MDSQNKLVGFTVTDPRGNSTRKIASAIAYNNMVIQQSNYLKSIQDDGSAERNSDRYTITWQDVPNDITQEERTAFIKNGTMASRSKSEPASTKENKPATAK